MSEQCQNVECGSQEKCQGCPSNAHGDLLKPTHKLNKIRNVIGVVSGKGGVGKSSVTSMLAIAAKNKGLKVGILDADITGPSIPKAFGITKQAYGTQEGIIPAKTKSGIEVMSINLLLKDPEQPVLWRGPILGNMVTQFWTDVIWGELDYLFVDMPPGTGDVPLTVFQSLPLTGIVVVTAAQDLVSMIVGKAIHMANQMNIPIIGLIENMSYFICPNCNEKHYIFGKSHLEEVSQKYQVPILSQMPLNSEIANLCDQGAIEQLKDNPLDEVIEHIIKNKAE